MKKHPDPWCGVAALRALHLPYAAQSFPGATYLRTEFCTEFDKWTTVYQDAKGQECVMVEMWQDPEGKTGRMAVIKPRGVLH